MGQLLDNLKFKGVKGLNVLSVLNIISKNNWQVLWKMQEPNILKILIL